MVAPRTIIVAADDDVAVLEHFVEPWPPFARTHRAAGRRNAARAQRLDIFLALDHEHDVLGGDGLDHLGQPIRDDAHALDRPWRLVWLVRWRNCFGPFSGSNLST